MEEYLQIGSCGNCTFQDDLLLSGVCLQPTTTIATKTYIFMQLVQWIIRSQCSISDACRRVTSTETKMKEFDFIVIGSGAGGSAISSLLSDNGNWSVLILEAGPEMPTISKMLPYQDVAVGTKYDWQYETIPQERACLTNGGVCKWPRGKMIGGTVGLSGRMYTRGHPAIYDKWGETNDGWSFKDVLPYFKKSENNSEPVDEIDKEFHGFEGPLPIGRYPYSPPLVDNLKEGIEELGLEIGDVNGRNQNRFSDGPIMVENGIFAGPDTKYLRSALYRKNFKVVINSLVTKIIFNKNGTRATGIEYHNEKGNVNHIEVRKEVILCAGVVNSPQLLLLSGIGPKKDLEKHNIPVIKDLPVGNNLHYHVGCTVRAKVVGQNDNLVSIETLRKFLEKRSGPFAGKGLTELTGFYATEYANHKIPDIQIFFDGYNLECKEFKFEKNITSINFRPVLLHPYCLGWIKLSSSNPHDKPLINPNYLCDNIEIKTMIRGVELMHNLTKTMALKKLVKGFDFTAYEECSHLQGKNFDEYWSCVITRYTDPENHHAGTCKMGPKDDPTAVVDNQLRVHGIQNLRVVDASFFPTQVNCNPISVIIMAAEKIAEIIKKTYQKR